MTVMFEHPATGLPFAMTVAVLRPDLVRIAVETAPAYPAVGTTISLAHRPPGQEPRADRT